MAKELPERFQCPCGSGLLKEAQYDAQNIFLCYTCEKCHKERMSHYHDFILSGYDQSDVDEPIEEDE